MTWDAESDAPALRNQGSCGSCWAISAVEAVEAQLQKDGGKHQRLAAQALVDCVPNPQHCGGTGGCDGATGELAFAYFRDHGIPLESELPYEAETQSCPQGKLDGQTQWPGRHITVEGWTNLPFGKAQPLMEALLQQPVVIAVDGNNWMNYESGIFDGCDKDAILGHAVLAVGFGEDSGKKYWRIQNSWGSDWGENGHIRMMKHDDEDAWCGTDNNPKEGQGCDGGPPSIPVCGMCGLLTDPLYPYGAKIVDGTSSSSVPSSSSFASQNAATNSEYKVWKPSDDVVSEAGKTDENKMQALLNIERLTR